MICSSSMKCFPLREHLILEELRRPKIAHSPYLFTDEQTNHFCHRERIMYSFVAL